MFKSEIKESVLDPATQSAVEHTVPWQVIVHNDPVNLMSYVTKVFQRVFGYSETKANHHMLEVHNLGRSIVWTGEREKAELYVQQLQGFLLLTSMEKVI